MYAKLREILENREIRSDLRRRNVCILPTRPAAAEERLQQHFYLPWNFRTHLRYSMGTFTAPENHRRLNSPIEYGCGANSLKNKYKCSAEKSKKKISQSCSINVSCLPMKRMNRKRMLGRDNTVCFGFHGWNRGLKKEKEKKRKVATFPPLTVQREPTRRHALCLSSLLDQRPDQDAYGHDVRDRCSSDCSPCLGRI